VKTPQKDTAQKFYRLFLILLGLGFLYLIWPFISNVVLLLVFAFLFTTILLPIVDWLEGKLKNRGLAVLLTVVVLLLSIVLFLSSFGVQLSREAFSTYQDFDQEKMMVTIENIRSSAISKLPTPVQEILLSRTDTSTSADKISEYIHTVLQSLTQLTTAIGSFIFFAIMLLIFTIIILYEYHHFKRSLVNFIPNKYFEIGIRLVRNIEKQVASYLHGQLLAATSVAILSTIGLFALNILVDANLTLIIFIGIIAGLANLIPLVGPFVGMVPAILIAIMNNISGDVIPAKHLFVVIGSIILMFIIVQQIDNNIITPKLVGKSVGIHPIMVIIALLIGGNLMGPVGMLVAVPATGTIKVISKEIMWAVRNAHLL